MAGRPRHRWLDLGCGVGTLAQVFDAADPSGSAIGIDLYREMLCEARRVHPALATAVADAARLPFRDRAFDLVVAAFMLHHVREQWRALAEVHRVMKADGLFAVATWGAVDAGGPAFKAWEQCLDRAGAPAKDPEPPPGWREAIDTPKRLEALLVDLGFAVDRVWMEERAWTWTPEGLADYLGHLGGSARRLERLPADRQAACRAAGRSALERLRPGDLIWRPQIVFGVARRGSDEDEAAPAGGMDG